MDFVLLRNIIHSDWSALIQSCLSIIQSLCLILMGLFHPLLDLFHFPANPWGNCTHFRCICVWMQMKAANDFFFVCAQSWRNKQRNNVVRRLAILASSCRIAVTIVVVGCLQGFPQYKYERSIRWTVIIFSFLIVALQSCNVYRSNSFSLSLFLLHSNLFSCLSYEYT